MVGAAKMTRLYRSLSWFRPHGRTSSRVQALVLTCTGGSCRGELQARWENRKFPQVPTKWLRQAPISRTRWWLMRGWVCCVVVPAQGVAQQPTQWPCTNKGLVSRVMVPDASWWRPPASAGCVAVTVTCPALTSRGGPAGSRAYPSEEGLELVARDDGASSACRHSVVCAIAQW
jgi:hypothetical protein